MLRHYDEHGVLTPTRVDPFSGYRQYAPALLRTARTIRALRDLGLGVAELAACAPLLDDAHAMRAVLDHQRARLLTEVGAVEARVREVDRLITVLEGTAMSTTSTAVERRTIPARTVASVRGTIAEYKDEGYLWQRLRSGLPAARAVPAPEARAVAVFHDDTYVEHDADVEVQLDVAAPFASAGDVRCVDVPALDVAVGVLHGSYEGIGEVMADLGRWVGEHDLRIDGSMFNVYRVGPSDNPDPSTWVTEVCLPVAPA
jgi:DNA-binding transcriptional MerR regulator